MVSVILIILFIWGFYVGFRRGFILQLVYTAGYTISYIAASTYYRQLANFLELFVPFPSANSGTKMKFFSEGQTLDLDKFFVAGVAFFLIYSVCYFLFRLLAIFAYGLRLIPFLGGINKILGGLGGLASVFLTAFMILKLLTILPINFLQSMLYKDVLVQAMMERIPFFSQNLQDLWVDKLV
jgi:uncharacterized membrane protein required for colicin V production